jgi:hypothetical protein
MSDPVISYLFADNEAPAPVNPLNQAPLPTLNQTPAANEETINSETVPDSEFND